MVDGAQSEHGHDGPAVVVNDQVKFEASGFPAWSLMPFEPACRVAV